MPPQHLEDSSGSNTHTPNKSEFSSNITGAGKGALLGINKHCDWIQDYFYTFTETNWTFKFSCRSFSVPYISPWPLQLTSYWHGLSPPLCRWRFKLRACSTSQSGPAVSGQPHPSWTDCGHHGNSDCHSKQRPDSHYTCSRCKIILYHQLIICTFRNLLSSG